MRHFLFSCWRYSSTICYVWIWLWSTTRNHFIVDCVCSVYRVNFYSFIFFISRHLGHWNRAYTKCLVFYRMEECLHLVCESMGVHKEDEVSVDEICSLYKSVFLITASLDETKRAISQVNKTFCGLRSSWMRRVRQKREAERKRKCFVWYVQVRGQSGGLSCPARGVLHVLLMMEKQRYNIEEVFFFSFNSSIFPYNTLLHSIFFFLFVLNLN